MEGTGNSSIHLHRILWDSKGTHLQLQGTANTLMGKHADGKAHTDAKWVH